MTISTYLESVDRILTQGHGLFPASGGDVKLNDSAGPPPPPPPPGGGSLTEGVSAAADDYEQRRAKMSALDSDANSAAEDGSEAGAQGRTGAGAIRDTARAQAGAIAPAATNSSAGVRLLTSTMDQRIGDMQNQINTANAQNKLIAIRMRQVASAFRGVSPMTGGGSGMPLSGVGGVPGGGGFNFGGLGRPIRSSRSDAKLATTALSSAATPPNSHIAAPAKGDIKGAVRYIYQAALARGLSDYDATAVAAYSLGEDASEDPTVSGGPQGGAGDENVVIGNFQEKAQFARDAGVDPADRYNIEGNVRAYLNTLMKNRGAGDIFHQLFATSKGGPFYTGGYPRMEELMGQARKYLNS